jgi:hypothetical protein
VVVAAVAAAAAVSPGRVGATAAREGEGEARAEVRGAPAVERPAVPVAPPAPAAPAAREASPAAEAPAAPPGARVAQAQGAPAVERPVAPPGGTPVAAARARPVRAAAVGAGTWVVRLAVVVRGEVAAWPAGERAAAVDEGGAAAA